MQALRRFDELLNRVSEEELAVIDAIIQKRDELAVVTNLSRGMPHPPSTLDEQSDILDDSFERRGLAWLMALARIEVAATAAGFSKQQQPFIAAGPSAHELPAYCELVMDGLRTHYWTLSADPDLPAVRAGQVEIQRSIVYGRRVLLTRQFLETVQRALAAELSPPQVNELKTWDKNLVELQNDIVGNIARYIRNAPPTEQVHLPCPSLAQQVQMGLASRGQPRGTPASTSPISSSSAIPAGPDAGQPPLQGNPQPRQ